ncbi:hypothetical protein ACGF0D_17860 [Kitasatospora sp. NPDC048298]|uniref:hypothetical protein n=1 Tax=Kitasatospora sp. NPDC048298 TaxID=3364049 RepID=UPI0037162544
MADLNWESVLGFFASEAQRSSKIVTRDQVAGPSKDKPWLRPIDKMVFDTSKFYNGTTDKGAVSGMGSPDVWWAWNYMHDTVPHSIRITVSVNYTDWGNDADKPLSQFIHQHEAIFAPLGSGGPGNDTVKPESLRYAADGISQVRAWLNLWQPRVQHWAELVNGPDSNWQGNAAGEFKVLLKQYALELETVRVQLENSPYEADLRSVADLLPATVDKLHSVHQRWWDSGKLWPSHAIYEALSTALAGVVPQLDSTAHAISSISTPLGDPREQGFYDQLELRAKSIWLDNVKKYLDERSYAYQSEDPNTAAVTVRKVGDPMLVLQDAYNRLDADFGFGYRNATLDLPTGPPTGAGDGGKDGGKDGGNGKVDLGGGSGGGKDGGADGGKGKVDLGGGSGGGAGAGAGGGTGGGSKTHLPPPPPVIGPGGGGSGIGDGAGTPILDKDHKPVLGADKKPVLLPPGGYIGKDGQVYDANGQKVIGKDGKPVVVPPGSDVPPGTGGGIYGTNAKVPKGSRVREDGTVIGPDGKEVLDRDGNPVVLPKGGSIAGDGTLLDSTGRPISDVSQRYTDRQHAIDAIMGGGSGGGGGIGSGGGTRLPATGSDWKLDLGSSFGGHDLESGAGGLGPYTGLLGGGGTGGLGAGGLGPGGGQLPKLVSSGGGVSARAIENSGGLTPGGKAAAAAAAESAAAEKAALQKASAMSAEEAAMRGRSMATSGGGMPMGPMGGGGMGGGQGEKDRQRTTWLAEDEEVWGTDTGAVSGVIGR